MAEQELTSSFGDEDSSGRPASSHRLDRFCRRAVISRIGQLDCGELLVRDRDGEWRIGGQRPGLQAIVFVSDLKFWRLLATGGSVGAGEAYAAGLWESPDLVHVIRVLAANRTVMDRMEQGSARLYGGLLKLLHRFARNSLAGSRKNISAHYDLGNEFFQQWLDERMQYSSALFLKPDESLDEAQRNKLARIADRLELCADDHVLEIGTGWGGLAVYMAETTGCRVTTTTISREQYAFACQQVRTAGLEERVEVLLKDYRELEGQYDKLISVEMIEAVGADFLDTYLATLQKRLKPGGRALIQAITIEDHRYKSALKSVDFIKRYIFPGSFIPSVSAITASMARSTSLGLVELFDMGESYALTLSQWRQRFDSQWGSIRKMGFDDAFRRRWRFYLAYCEGGFEERAISNVQLVLADPQWRKSASGA